MVIFLKNLLLRISPHFKYHNHSNHSNHLAPRLGRSLERDDSQPSTTRAVVMKTIGADFVLSALTSNSHIYTVSQNAAA